MENPFTALGEAIHEGLEKLHRRADMVEDDVSTFKRDVEDFKAEVAEGLGRVAAFGERLSKLEALFAPEAVQAATDKVQAAGGDGSKAAEPEAETPADTPPQATVITPTSTTTIAVVPAGAEATPVLTGTGSVTVDPGTTVHNDTATGVTTTVPHDGSDATAMTAAGTPVAADPAVVAEAVSASADAGVAVAAPAAPEVAPVV